MQALRRRLSICIGVLLLTPAAVIGQTVTAAWDPNPPTDLVLTYEVCISSTALSCNIQRVTVPGTQTSYTFAPTPGVLNRVAVRAVSALGAGDFSAELLVSVPALAAIADKTSTVNTAIAPFTVAAIDPDGSKLTFSHTGLPFGLTLDQSTGVISGTPTSTGVYNVIVLVSDALVTTSAAFRWTIQSGSGDSTPPTLAITSHAPGQTVTTSSITLAGTATDAGTGDTGISSVRVNGVITSGGTATGAGTAAWSRAVSLVNGANLLTIMATDRAGNARTSQITINLSLPDTAAPSLSITSHVQGQTVSASSITLGGIATDSGSGGSGIASVTINGTPAAGGTAPGSNTTTWSGSVALAGGSNAITVIATDGAGNSRQIPLTINRAITPEVQTISASPATGTGSNQTFALQYSDNRGASSLSTEWVWFAGGAGICLAYHDRASNVVYLVNDEGTGWYSRPLGSGTLQNSYCGIALGSSSSSANGNTLTLNLAFTFTPAFSGTKSIRMFANGIGAYSSGWQDRGSWTVPAISAVASAPSAVSAVAVTPSSGSGTSQTFSMQYSAGNTSTSLLTEWVWFAGGNWGSCLAYHDRSTNTLNLLNDTGTAWFTQPLGGGTLQNSACLIESGASSVAMSGGTLTLNLAVTFTPGFSGTKTVRMFANAVGGVASGWQDRGTWTVPTGSTSSVQPGVNAISVTPGSGSGNGQTFALQYSDSRGATNLVSEWVWFSGTGLCIVHHERLTNKIYLINDEGTGWLTGTLGNGTVQNSYCAVTLSSSYVSVTGGTLTLNLAMWFKPTFSGTKSIEMFANALGQLSSGWQTRGTWIVP